MKNYKVIFLLVAIFLFIGVKDVNADIGFRHDCYETNSIKKCDFYIDVTENSIKIRNLEINFTLKGLALSNDGVKLENKYKMISSDYNNLNFKIVSDVITYTPATYKIGTFTFNKLETNCSLKYFPFFERFKGCTIEGGTYYDKNGDKTDELTYKRQCAKHYCETLTVGGTTIYYDRESNEITKEEYDALLCDGDKTCFPKNKGETAATYYGKDGRETSKFEHDKQCFKYACEYISDGTTTIYYDMDSNEVDKATYEKICCEKKKCEKDGNKYYGENGEEVDELTYQKTCEKHSCEILSDGTIYGKNGNVVNQETYDLECKNHTCEVIGDKYFDNNGALVNKEKYEEACTNPETPKCKVVDNKYYDDKGNVVSKEKYDKACTNPQTGSSISYSLIVIGLLISGTLLFIGKRYSKLRKI